MRHSILVSFVAALASVTAAPLSNPHPPAEWLTALSDHETFAAAGLTNTDQQQIIRQVQTTSFDTPESWIAELRVRRISLGGGTDGLLIRGTQLLCGATGNCQTWLFRRSNQRWSNMFEGEAPVVASVGFVTQTKKVNDVLAMVHVSAGAASWVQYAFDGRFYREVSRGSEDTPIARGEVPAGDVSDAQNPSLKHRRFIDPCRRRFGDERVREHLLSVAESTASPHTLVGVIDALYAWSHSAMKDLTERKKLALLEALVSEESSDYVCMRITACLDLDRYVFPESYTSLLQRARVVEARWVRRNGV